MRISTMTSFVGWWSANEHFPNAQKLWWSANDHCLWQVKAPNISKWESVQQDLVVTHAARQSLAEQLLWGEKQWTFIGSTRG
eukprot:SAG11_NODE_53_length_19648_cov_14.691902_15_plen_82_part_00